MPAEWSRHACTFMEWPVTALTWKEALKKATEAYAAAAMAISEFEPVFMLAPHGSVDAAAAACGPKVKIIPMEYDDSWVRDNGPTFLIDNNKQLAAVNWGFNAWGGKEASWSKDDRVAPTLLELLGVERFDAPVILEGGSIHTDGEGTLLTTEQCLLNKNRNPRLTRRELEIVLEEYLGVKKIIWLKQGLEGDRTDGHIDNVACFAGPGRVLLQACEDPADPNYHAYLGNLEILEGERDYADRRLEIFTVAQPSSRLYKGKRLPLSYINLYFVNGGLIYPVFGGECAKSDERAGHLLRELFPEREVVGLDCSVIIKGGGSIHCITQQMPDGLLPGKARRFFN